MKKYFFIIAVLFSASVCAQQATFSKTRNPHCPVDHKCSLKVAHHVDGSETFKTNDFGLADISHLSDKQLEVSLLKVNDKSGNSMVAIVFSGEVNDCTDGTSYVVLLLKNGERMQLPCMVTQKTCHINYIMVGLTKADVAVLSSSDISRVKMHYIDKEEHFDVDVKGQLKFMREWQCIISVQ